MSTTDNPRDPDTKPDKSGEITMPDFKEWTRAILFLPSHFDHSSSIEQSLKDAFEQGRVLGQREGRELADKYWYIHQDFELSEGEVERLQEDIKNAKQTGDAEWEDWETASCADYLKWEEEREKILKSDLQVHEKLIELIDIPPPELKSFKSGD